MCTASTKCKILVCAPPLQWIIPWTASALYLDKILLMIGAYVLVGESTNLPASIGEEGFLFKIKSFGLKALEGSEIIGMEVSCLLNLL